MKNPRGIKPPPFKVRLFGSLIVLLGTILSFIISNLPCKQEQGLYGVAQLFAPLLVGFLGVFVFLISTYITTNKIILNIILSGITSYVVYVGFDLSCYKFW